MSFASTRRSFLIFSFHLKWYLSFSWRQKKRSHALWLWFLNFQLAIPRYRGTARLEILCWHRFGFTRHFLSSLLCTLIQIGVFGVGKAAELMGGRLSGTFAELQITFNNLRKASSDRSKSTEVFGSSSQIFRLSLEVFGSSLNSSEALGNDRGNFALDDQNQQMHSL